MPIWLPKEAAERQMKSLAPWSYTNVILRLSRPYLDGVGSCTDGTVSVQPWGRQKDAGGGSSSAAMEAAVTAPTSLYAGLDTSLDAIIAGIGHALRKAGAHARVGDAIDRALQIYNQP